MCKCVAKEPQQLKCTCGAFYCKSCLARITSTSAMHKSDCPVKYKNEHLDHFPDHKSNERIQKLMVKCTNSDRGCDWTGQLKDLDDHCSHQCPKETIPCTLSEVGCETPLLREDLDVHIAKNQTQHFELAVKSILRLRQELATTQGKLQKVEEALSKSSQTVPKVFRLSNYEHFKTKDHPMYSTPFYSRSNNQCKLCLCVRPLQTWNNSEQVGVSLELLTSSEHSIAAISLTVAVLSQERDGTHHSFTPRPNWASPKTYEEKIMVSTYLRNDCLFFRVSEKECDERPWLVDPPMPRSDLVSYLVYDKPVY